MLLSFSSPPIPSGRVPPPPLPLRRSSTRKRTRVLTWDEYQSYKKKNKWEEEEEEVPSPKPLEPHILSSCSDVMNQVSTYLCCQDVGSLAHVAGYAQSTNLPFDSPFSWKPWVDSFIQCDLNHLYTFLGLTDTQQKNQKRLIRDCGVTDLHRHSLYLGVRSPFLLLRLIRVMFHFQQDRMIPLLEKYYSLVSRPCLPGVKITLYVAFLSKLCWSSSPSIKLVQFLLNIFLFCDKIEDEMRITETDTWSLEERERHKAQSIQHMLDRPVAKASVDELPLLKYALSRLCSFTEYKSIGTKYKLVTYYLRQGSIEILQFIIQLINQPLCELVEWHSSSFTHVALNHCAHNSGFDAKKLDLLCQWGDHLKPSESVRPSVILTSKINLYPYLKECDQCGDYCVFGLSSRTNEQRTWWTCPLSKKKTRLFCKDTCFTRHINQYHASTILAARSLTPYDSFIFIPPQDATPTQ